MLKREIQNIFECEKIKYAEAIPYSLTKRNESCKKTAEFSPNSAVVFLIPYFNGVNDGNVSVYAQAKDYHLYCKELEKRIVPVFEEITNEKAALFADTSPIYEVDAALTAGLGVKGKNGLLINREYSSFVFIASLLTTAKTDALTDKKDYAVSECINCGRCKENCPVNLDKSKCISSITQKKGQLSDDEITALKNQAYVWGCDVCQLVCPYTEKMIKNGTKTEIEFFKTDIVSNVTLKYLENISKKDFEKRAFSWRGKKVLSRNIGICEEK